MTGPFGILADPPRPTQVGILVEDMDRAIASWSTMMPGSHWDVYRYEASTLVEASYRGAPAGFAMLCAICGDGPQIELIEVLAGPSVYHEFIDSRGYGLHHLGYHVEDLDGSVAQLREAGIEPIQVGRGTGADGTGGFAYFESPEDDVVLELIERPRRRVDPLWQVDLD